MRKLITTAIAALIVTLPLAAMGGKEADRAKAPLTPAIIRIGAIKGPTGIGAIRLFEADKALPDNASFEIEAIASADAMAAKLLSGGLEAAVLPVNMAAKLYNAGIQYRMMAVVGNGMVKIVSTDPAIRSLSDLRGRDVYVAGQGATPEFLLRTVLAKSGIDADKDLRLIFSMPYPELAASIVAGKVDIAVLPEPFATLALRGNASAKVPFSLSESWTAATGQGDYPMSVFVVSSSLIAERPAAVKALLAAYESSIRSIMADPAAAGILVEKHSMGLTASIAAAAIPYCAFTFLPSTAARPSVEALLSVFLAMAPASIGSRMPDGAWYAFVAR